MCNLDGIIVTQVFITEIVLFTYSLRPELTDVDLYKSLYKSTSINPRSYFMIGVLLEEKKKDG